MISRGARITAPSLAALTCGVLLQRRGWAVRCVTAAALPSGAIMLRPATARLLCDLWDDPAGALIADAHAVRQRIVRWGTAPETRVAQPGLVVDLARLLTALAARLAAPAADDALDWMVAARPGDATALGEMARAGRRQAWISQVRLRDAAAEDTAVLEQCGRAWFMLLPRGGGHAVLHSVGLDGEPPPPPPGIAALIGRALTQTGPFAAMPRLRIPAARGGLIALGEAALGLDPLCGDGAGHALRGAWAAAEALTAADTRATLDTYTQGLRFAFDRHVAACASLYAACGPAWAAESPPFCR